MKKLLFLLLTLNSLLLTPLFSQERPKSDAEKPKNYNTMSDYVKYRFMTQEEVDALGLKHDKTFRKYHESTVEKGDIKDSIAFFKGMKGYAHKPQISFITLMSDYVSHSKDADPFHRDLKITIVGFPDSKKLLEIEQIPPMDLKNAVLFVEVLKVYLNAYLNAPAVKNERMSFEFFYNDNEVVIKVTGTNIKEENSFKERFEKGITDPKQFCFPKEKTIYKSKDGSFTVYGNPGTRPVVTKAGK